MRPKDAERAKAAGVRDCIRKPNTLDEMRQMVTACCRTPNPSVYR